MRRLIGAGLLACGNVRGRLGPTLEETNPLWGPRLALQPRPLTGGPLVTWVSCV